MARSLTCLICAAGLLLAQIAAANESSKGSVETRTRFLEYDAGRSSLIYEVSLRNVGNLPVSYIELDSDPASIEGSFSVDELGSGDWAKRRFSFKLAPRQKIFQPRFVVAFTDYEGQRIRSEEERSTLAANVDFSYCDVNTGWVDMIFTLTNLGDEPLLFLELRSENPRLPQEFIEKESLSPGEEASWTLEFQLEPGETLFNPTLYLEYYAFGVSGTRLQKKFFTFLQEDLRKVQNALADRESKNP